MNCCNGDQECPHQQEAFTFAEHAYFIAALFVAVAVVAGVAGYLWGMA